MKNPDWLSCLGYSLRVRGRRSKGKRKGVRAREKARGRREERPPRSRAPKFPLPLPFLTSATQATLGIENPWLFTTLHWPVSFFFLTYSCQFPAVKVSCTSLQTVSHSFDTVSKKIVSYVGSIRMALRIGDSLRLKNMRR